MVKLWLPVFLFKGILMIKPISPLEILHKIPDEVVEVFNKEIQDNWNGRSVIIKKKTIIPKILALYSAHLKTITENKLYEMNWLDIEETYQKAGWKVRYASPDRDESFDAFWTFSK